MAEETSSCPADAIARSKQFSLLPKWMRWCFRRRRTRLAIRTVTASLGLSLALAVFSPVGAGPLPAPTSNKDFQYNGFPPRELVDLGRNLFFDKILSGEDDVSCSSCHNPRHGTGDCVSLGLGVGATGSCLNRVPGEGTRNRIVRNSPGLYNLGWRGISSLMTDGDISLDASQPTGFKTPAGQGLPGGLHNILAAQNMFPTNQPREMAGTDPKNPVSAASVALDNDAVWQLYAEKVAEIPAYVDQFRAAFPDVQAAEDITFVHIANALAAFQMRAFRADNSPFDRYLRRDPSAMTVDQIAGMELFYGDAGCDTCHSGIFQSDMSFHAISVPQIGPGRANGVSGGDFGRARITRNRNDLYRYRTPMLRNVALTAPYGHDGTFATLEAIVRHHLDPLASLEAYETSQAILPEFPFPLPVDDFAEHNDLTKRDTRASFNGLDPVSLTDEQVRLVVEFLHALTDPRSLDTRGVIPTSVPSGLPVED